MRAFNMIKIKPIKVFKCQQNHAAKIFGVSCLSSKEFIQTLLDTTANNTFKWFCQKV